VTTATTPTTVRGLTEVLAPFGPVAEGEDLVFTAAPPAELDALLRVLHTGVRAGLTGRRWVGCDGTTGRVAALNPAAPIPAGVTLLCVEGDTIWDRIDGASRLDRPRLFALPPRRVLPGGGSVTRPHREQSGE
jgi:hypothetical protein